MRLGRRGHLGSVLTAEVEGRCLGPQEVQRNASQDSEEGKVGQARVGHCGGPLRVPRRNEGIMRKCH